MLIRDAEIDFTRRVNVRIEAGRIVDIAEIGEHLPPRAGEVLLDARGAALLPGLHDHHIHLVALAASLESLHCGPPQIASAEQLGAALRQRAAEAIADNDEWIRGIGYHESVAGDIDRDWLDRQVPDRPVRIQQRSGRLWIVNSRALELLCAGDSGASTEILEMRDGRPTGRLYDADVWLRQRLGGRFPSLRRVGALLADFGVTGVTDTTPHNDLAQYRRFAAARKNGELAQDLLIMGDASLDAAEDYPGIRRGATKIHLHEIALPPFDELCATIRRSHAVGRPVAIHCVTLAELVFSTTALANCDAFNGDRIEHAALAPPDVLPLLAEQGLTVVTQPNFIRERGDAYLTDVPVADQPWLYRLRGLLDAGIPVGGSTDAPFGHPDPWLAMHAAVQRRTLGGSLLGAEEALSPEEALALFTSPPLSPGGTPRRVEVGTIADLCLLDCPWEDARRDLSAVRVAATIKAGELIWRQPSPP